MTSESIEPDGVALRSATRDDWSAIERLLVSASLPLAGAESHLDHFVIAEREGRAIGCAAVERHGAAGLLRSVAVADEARGLGLGVALVQRSIADARVADLDVLALLTTTAAGFFPRFGFRLVARVDLPRSLAASEEFRGACPDSATAMRLELAELAMRPAREADAADVAAIYNEGIAGRGATFETTERTAADVRAWLAASAADRRPFLVAERRANGGSRVMGWARASEYRPRACYAGIAEISIYVASSARGRGVGDALMRALIAESERAGLWKLLSRVFPENAASRAMCARNGFREVGTYEKHARLDGAWRDVVIVERLLTANMDDA